MAMVRAVLPVIVALGMALSGAAAQHAARFAPDASVAGRVDTPGEKRQVAVPGVFVTLHRVGPDSSGAIDSTRTDASGRYELTYARSTDDQSIYFTAVVYRGIAYFSAPLKSKRATGDAAAITVFDTTSKPHPFQVQGHHLVIAAPRPDGMRDVVEVWELSNDTTVTVVGRDSLAPVWTAVLPKGAQKLTAGQGDVGADAIVERGGRVALIAPFGPGVKQISYTFSLPASAFPLDVPLETPTSVLEVLVEEPLATVKGALLRATAAATTQGRTFKRFQGQDVPKGERIHVAMPATTASYRQAVLAGLASVIALLMAGALWTALSRRDRTRAPVTIAPSIVERLASEIAALDARHERGDPALTPVEYAETRAALKSRLTAALAPANDAT